MLILYITSRDLYCKIKDLKVQKMRLSYYAQSDLRTVYFKL